MKIYQSSDIIPALQQLKKAPTNPFLNAFEPLDIFNFIVLICAGDGNQSEPSFDFDHIFGFKSVEMYILEKTPDFSEEDTTYNKTRFVPVATDPLFSHYSWINYFALDKDMDSHIQKYYNKYSFQGCFVPVKEIETILRSILQASKLKTFL